MSSPDALRHPNPVLVSDFGKRKVVNELLNVESRVQSVSGQQISEMITWWGIKKGECKETSSIT